MELNKYIGDKIKRFREARSLTQDELAEKLGTTRQSVSRYETGDRKANQDILFDLAEIFNVKVDDFFPAREKDSSNNTKNILSLITETTSQLKESRQKEVLTFAKQKLRDQEIEEELEYFNNLDERTLRNLHRYAEEFGIDALDDLFEEMLADEKTDDGSADHNAG